MSDAYAFLRTILKQPTDPVAPLVFADWLEESGERDKLIWARYIRARDALERLGESDAQRGDLREQVEFFAKRIRYRIRIHASNFVPYALPLVKLLPPPQWTVDLEEYDAESVAVAIAQETMCRVYRMMPLSYQADQLVLAIADTKGVELIFELENFLGIRIVPVLAAPDQVQEAIDRHYPVKEHHEFLCGG